MQTKSSYRVLRWTLMASMAASLATACVVTTGSSDDDFSDGGQGGSSTAGTSGSTSTPGGAGASSTTAGTSSGGTAAGGMSMENAGASPGGAPPATYVPGLCQADTPTPSSEPSCDPSDSDTGNDCKICLKSMCCTEWKTCYGSEPTTACGWGATEEADGQFDCIVNCFQDGAATATDPDQLLGDCSAMCANQCDSADNGIIMDSTNDLVGCANTNCTDECFPF